MKFLDLFAGIGGFRIGMESAGHECIGFCEIDKFARASYKAIHDTKGEIELHDITTVSDDTIRGIGSVDIICGGFPCQAFSIAGNRRGFEDTRGTLFFEIARFASILRPKYLFLENVKGLLNHENGVTFETIISTLDELGYNVEWQVLNSKNFGVPQNRERVFIIGHSRKRGTRRVFPLSGKNQSTSNQSVMKIGNINPSGNGMNGEVYQADGLAPTLTTNKGEGQKIAIKSNTIKQFGVLQPNFYQCGAVYETDGIAPTIRAYQGGGLEPKIIQRGHGYNQGGEHDIAPTLTSNSYHENNHLSDGFRIRKLTPKECWRLQGFPDWAFDKAQEVNSNSQLYKQVGNSVTVNVISAIAQGLG
ncbi:DNA cytosine methyltransferase [Streptococcus pneumoniae]|uniref:DNA cytosine methyltransferase n=3 Tax=Streptococcus pneumoniae TaxID=1313 RepID=UPI00067BCEE2|nr:DNA cytosine methyltransferase [Streptococcus pneumoniae]MDG7766340.1 DNA cytosine methyltransferase [Streptococcus pneumoniae]MDG7790101.1 DNA cytosine methyltransferase [Streptococcus pneumoniae]MDG8079775.1 DNA cytosine methyltransferase [Streptococcus pneumoniae]MDG8594369.1 DNA cytosine methyltransferase [Streptococcus pneumoniae]MDG9138970.1 DNA cytosine methyltransferase [Streptococcus pneumoniae]